MKTARCELTVIVLTRDEACHLFRLINSFEKVSCRIVIVDSGSTDGTPELARSLGAEVISHPFENHAAQFNWALDHIPIDSPWTMRMDADEYLTPELADELSQILPTALTRIGGFEIRRRIFFWGRWIRHGGYYPTKLL
ncbi:spsA-like protein, partial [mine drainage metagenome]